jgi:hypothetical protein
MGINSYNPPLFLSHVGVFIITYAAQFDLHAMRPHFP